VELTLGPFNLRLLNSVRIWVLNVALEEKYLYGHKVPIGSKFTIVFTCYFDSGNISFKKIQQDATVYQIFFIPYLYEA
jgi:hypothetical protein